MDLRYPRGAAHGCWPRVTNRLDARRAGEAPREDGRPTLPALSRASRAPREAIVSRGRPGAQVYDCDRLHGRSSAGSVQGSSVPDGSSRSRPERTPIGTLKIGRNDLAGVRHPRTGSIAVSRYTLAQEIGASSFRTATKHSSPRARPERGRVRVAYSRFLPS